MAADKIYPLLQQIESAVLSTLGPSGSNQLGTYNYPTTIPPVIHPAIWIDDGRRQRPQEPIVTGLEAVIVAPGNIDISPLIGSNVSYLEKLAPQIKLRQWDISNTTIQPLANLILGLGDYLIKEVTRQPRATRLDNIETCTITLNFPIIMRIEG